MSRQWEEYQRSLPPRGPNPFAPRPRPRRPQHSPSGRLITYRDNDPYESESELDDDSDQGRMSTGDTVPERTATLTLPGIDQPVNFVFGPGGGGVTIDLNNLPGGYDADPGQAGDPFTSESRYCDRRTDREYIETSTANALTTTSPSALQTSTHYWHQPWGPHMDASSNPQYWSHQPNRLWPAYTDRQSHLQQLPTAPSPPPLQRARPVSTAPRASTSTRTSHSVTRPPPRRRILAVQSGPSQQSHASSRDRRYPRDIRAVNATYNMHNRNVAPSSDGSTFFLPDDPSLYDEWSE